MTPLATEPETFRPVTPEANNEQIIMIVCADRLRWCQMENVPPN